DRDRGEAAAVPVPQSAFVRARRGAGRERGAPPLGGRMGRRGAALGPRRHEPDAAPGRRRHDHRQPGTERVRLSDPDAVPPPQLRRLRLGPPARRDVRLSAAAMRALAFLLLAAAGPAAAQLSLSGEWVGRYLEDFADRIPGGVQGDYTGVPMNDAARRYAEEVDVTRAAVLEHQCQPYNAPHIYRGPLQFRIWEEKDPATEQIIAYRKYLGTYQQWRTIWMDGRPHPPEHAPHTFMGFSTGEWHGDILTVTTTHIKKEFYRRSGIPSSDRTTMIEHYIRHGNLLSHVVIVTDPDYLTEPYITSQEFVLMERGNQNWLYNCEYAMEVPKPKNDVPHYLPGENPFIRDFADKFGLPFEAVWAGAEAMYPEYMPTVEALMHGQAQ